MALVTMFVNGQAMSGGTLNDALHRARLLGPAVTAPRYQFFSVRDEFPGLHPVSAGGHAVPGELYEVEYDVLREELLPREPEELELGVIELADGGGSLSMRMRREALDRSDVTDISELGGWLAYRATLR
ncbi:allophanate hydrolase-related protein [Rhodococcus sp. NBC_00294]|uniref:allophanate hydrolase-related protein n=1 Tax=Rhodococcus sp. NBC_00294 TaxID=2976004 RepID=UPI002E2B176F|nr:gamma-glutamylcyclotransferase [Rhodococcus sp. NBC_00294]